HGLQARAGDGRRADGVAVGGPRGPAHAGDGCPARPAARNRAGMIATATLDAWQRLDAADFAEWDALARASASSNPFLMPGFVQAAARWLTPQAPPTLLRVRDGDGTLIGVTCLERRRPNLFVPLPHW